MKEEDWVNSIYQEIERELKIFDETLRVSKSKKLPYSNEILEYNDKDIPINKHLTNYETDILIYEKNRKKCL